MAAYAIIYSEVVVYKRSAWAPSFAISGAHASGRAGQPFQKLKCAAVRFDTH